MVQQSINRIFITQEEIGLHYARIKMSKKTGVDINTLLQISTLDKKQLEKVQSYAEESIHEEEFPAVLSPDGQLFIVDGHHNLYMAVLAKLNLNTSLAQLKVIKDYTGAKKDFFAKDLVERHLIYSHSGNELLVNPRTIDMVGDSVERSLMGLAFIHISEKYDIPFKGSAFKPFIQFDLADLINSSPLFDFTEDYSPDNVKRLAKVILDSQELINYLEKNLAPNASKKVVEFLSSLKKNKG